MYVPASRLELRDRREVVVSALDEDKRCQQTQASPVARYAPVRYLRINGSMGK